MVKIVGYLEDSLIVFLRGKFCAYEEPGEEKIQTNKTREKIERKKEEKRRKRPRSAGKILFFKNFRFLRLVWISLSSILLPKYPTCMLV